MNTGGPAFPGPYVNDKGGLEAVWKQGGMTLRDYFAAKALEVSIYQVKNYYGAEKSAVANWCYDIADAMLEAREK